MKQGLPIGTRVRFNDRCPWPERVGLTATVVDPPTPGIYPADKPFGKHVLLRVDGDPLRPRRPEWRRGWSCVASVDSVDVLEGA